MKTENEIWEQARIAALHKLKLLDTPAEARFDRIVHLAQSLFEVPIALVSLVDTDRQWFKASRGLDAPQTPRDVSFCNHAIRQPDQLFIVEDTLKDARFKDNPLVLGDPGIRFYAGAVLSTSDGYPVGTLCIIDRKQRTLTNEDAQKLKQLAEFASAELILTPESETPRQSARLSAGLDPVTGLYDIENFKAHLAELKQEIDQDSRFDLLLVQLPNLTAISRRHNVRMADRILIETCTRIQTALTGAGYLGGRISSDAVAFLITMGTAKDPGFSDHIKTLVEQPIETGTEVVQPAAGIHLLDYNPALHDDDDLLLMAEKILSMPPGNGDLTTESRLEIAQSSLKLARRIAPALENREIKLYYQPKVCTRGGKIRGFEALIRWQDGEGGFIPAIKTVSAAEDAGFLEDLTLWTVQEATRVLGNWIERFAPQPPFSLSVNIPPLCLHSSVFVDQVINLVRRHDLPSGYLEFEILEDRQIEESRATIDNINRLVAAGIHLSVDDFGTGYGSLSYLSRLPLQTIKVDRSFTSGLSGDAQADFIARSIVGMGRNAGLCVIAEGVETEKQLELLAEMGCQLVQGFLFAPAVPEEEALLMIERGFAQQN